MDQILLIIKDWQTLIGIGIGAIISVVGFWFQNWLQKRSQRGENMRKIEIYTAQTLNDINDLMMTLNNFVMSIDRIISEIDSRIENEQYVLSETNFPPFEFYLDESYSEMKTDSFYIHNKILRMISFIKRLNFELREQKNNFSSFTKKNEFLVIQKASFKEQKQTYKENLVDFKKLVQENMNKHILDTAKILTQLKIYNAEVRKRFGFIYIWKNEGRSFKYFKTKQTFDDFLKFPNFIERIDTTLDSEVNKILDLLKKNR